MKKNCLFLFLLLGTSILYSQYTGFDNSRSQLVLTELSFHSKNDSYAGIFIISGRKNSLTDTIVKNQSDTLKTLPVNIDTTKKSDLEEKPDSTLFSQHGYLLNDDPVYNKKAPLWRPILGAFTGNLFIASMNKFIFREQWSKISWQTIKDNWNNGWEWDADRFGVNFFQHPYSGALGFNEARVKGYGYWESVPFAFGTSLMWEQFMENTRPSYNDLINTSISGSLLGEIMYRLSSSFLDDRLTGSKRLIRELFAGIIDPVRFANRFIDGDLTRVTKKDVYQREPLQASIFLGVLNVNEGTGFWNGQNSGELVFNFSYGDPLENRSRKPFDYFKFRLGFNVGVGRKIVNNIMGYGLLTGKNVITKKSGLLYGIFQNYDYWDNNIDELGTLGAGAGIIHRINLGEHSDITSHIHLGLVPMAGIKSPLFDSVGERNYDYAGGLEAMVESSFNIGGWANISASYFVYGLRTYIGSAGNYIVGIFRPRIAVKVINNIYIGFEFLQYGKDAFLRDLPDFHIRNNEQRVFISLSGGYFGIP